ncbi:mechanosensitive ion channel family protein [Zavarzinia sp. CC-PAN008]|uniref:mechanosensitive ion channel family protein n=1 Tax=Zavarzinia sp. CC-PAN008 TaxID=3243332 RepID=UPI003F7491F3
MISLVILGATVVVALAIHQAVLGAMTRLVRDRDLLWRSLVQRLSGPVRLALIMGGVSFGATIAPLSPVQAGALRHVMLVCFIGLVGWAAISALHIWTTLYMRRFKLDTEDNLLARKHVTQTRILRRVMDIVIVVITVAIALMTFEAVREVGVTLLAAGGAAGIVVGLALQPLLKNLIAGIQLAITQPIRIDDALLIEGEWGRVEEITSTYVVIRCWDWRRLIVPLARFIEEPFQNWTRENASLIGTVMIYVDYSAPVSVLRAKLEELAKASPLWDGQVVNLAVTDFRETTMEIRMLVSAANAGSAFDLRCEMRERMIAFLQQAYPQSLPRRRLEAEANVQQAAAA